MTAAVDANQSYIAWRDKFLDVIRETAQTTERAFPALDTRLLARFAAADVHLRVWTNPGAALLIGLDFIGAQMPLRARPDGFGPGLADSLDEARTLWTDSLTTPPTGQELAAVPMTRRTGVAPHTTSATAKELLRQTMRSTHDLFEDDGTSRNAFAAHVTAGVMAWSAYRYLEALHRADPRLAAEIVADVAEQLDSGEIGAFAYDAATAAGFDAQKWQDDFEAAASAATQQTTS
ncbi:hypothetical protein [Streptomyces sp. NPDC048659]|uniref:hypothetical protein n=1 Tax=Streptomyces sp. NPDC048659 TaxID=3155489 RepID=UPI003414562C